MYQAAIGPHQLWRTSSLARLLTLTLAATAVAASAQLADPRLGVLATAYAALIAAGWLLGPKTRSGWLAYLMPLADVAAVTAFLVVLGPPPAPLWMLYVIPIAGAAAAGQKAALLAGVASVLGYLAALPWTMGQSLAELAWPAMLLLSAALIRSMLAINWQAEREAQRAWTETVAAARGLVGSSEPDTVATTVAERARRLARADRAWLWWCSPGGECRGGPPVGETDEAAPSLFSISPELARQLDRGVVELSGLGEAFAGRAGEVVALGRGENRLALLAVMWDTPPNDRAVLRARLRLLSPWAEHALHESRIRAAALEQQRREEVLRRVAARLAGTLDRTTVCEAVSEAARSGLGVRTRVAEGDPASIQAGEEEEVGPGADAPAPLIERLLPTPLAAGAAERSGPIKVLVDRPADNQHAENPDAWLAFPVGKGVALLVQRSSPPLEPADTAWLRDLAAIGRAAWGRCVAHEQLRLAEDRLQQMVQAAPAPIAVWDAEGKLVLANTAYRSLGLVGPMGPVPPSGVREEEIVVGDPPRTFVLLTTRLSVEQYVLSLYREVTRERQALRDKEELIALVGHELRTPLTSIQGYSQMMARQLHVVEEQAGQLNRLIADLMRAAPSEGSHLPLTRVRVDLPEQARSAAERFRARHEGRELRVELHDAPAVHGDPSRLGQVLDNLLDNAAKYSPAEAAIVLRVERDAGEAVICVEDRGIGIAAEHLPRLFDRFYRAPDQEGESRQGLGLGLFVVRELVEAHGGRVWVDSEGPGQGSTFRVALPAAVSSDAARQTPRRAG